MARRNQKEEKDVYCIFPRQAGIVRRVGQFEFSCTVREASKITYSWRYLPEPGEPSSDYTGVDNYSAYTKQIIDHSKSHSAQEHIYGWRHFWQTSESLLELYRLPVNLRKSLEEAIKMDHKVWVKARAAEQVRRDKGTAESLGITITEFRKQKAASRKAEKTIDATSDEMKISMFLVSLRDQVDTVLSALKHRRASLEVFHELRAKIGEFNGPTWVKAKSVARRADKEMNKKKK